MARAARGMAEASIVAAPAPPSSGTTSSVATPPVALDCGHMAAGVGFSWRWVSAQSWRATRLWATPRLVKPRLAEASLVSGAAKSLSRTASYGAMWPETARRSRSWAILGLTLRR
ncbi:MAG: hypothetical protein AMS16_03390 [Planctomycetes bacterium DG_58]|nr:MAG: hypothetical protein AMS16_03390 [Planctomycetes bacterium DG_58]